MPGLPAEVTSVTAVPAGPASDGIVRPVRPRPPAPRPARTRRQRVAHAVVTCLAVVVAAVVVPSSAASAAPITADVGLRAVTVAASHAGKPYAYGATGPDSFDCSGLVQRVFGALGVTLPRTAAQQYAATVHLPQSQVRPGDVVFFSDSSGAVYHDGIYAGNGQMWAATHTGDVVRLEDVWTSSWSVGRPAPGASSAGAASPLLRTGSSGPAVADVQRALGVTADGAFGPRTAAAVVAFQLAHGLTPDGVVGPLTEELLLSARAAAPPAPPAPSAPAPPARPAAAPVRSSPAPAAPTAHALLVLGRSGPDVVVLQRAVHVAADGAFGPQTLAAVVAFQRGAGLTPDGVVGPLTWRALGV